MKLRQILFWTVVLAAGLLVASLAMLGAPPQA